MDMLRQLVFILCLTLTTAEDQQDAFAPEARLVFRMFEEIGKHQDLIMDRLSAIASTQEQKEAILAVRPLQVARATGDQAPDTSTNCVGCQAVFTVAPFLFKSGLKFESVKTPAAILCQLVFAFINMNNPFTGEVLCESLVGSFGPHVEIIAKKVNMNAQDSCYLLVYCRTNAVSLDIPALISRLLSQRSAPFRDELAPRPFLMLPDKNLMATKPARRSRRQAGMLKIVQITDVHVDMNYKEGTPTDCGLPLCCHELPAHWPKSSMKGSAGPYGDYKCNVPPATTKLFLDKLRQLNPDIILFTGDSPSNTVWLETQERQLNSTKWVAAQLKNYFPNVMGIYSCIGNHEMYPVNMYYAGHPDTEEFNKVFFDTYKDLSHFTSEQEATIKYAGYYSILIRKGLRLLSLNSLFGETSNWYNLINRAEPHFNMMIQFMRNTLQNARLNSEKVIIIIHHPMGDSARDLDERLTTIIVEFHDVIVLNMAGHRHIDEFRLFRDDNGKTYSVQFISQTSNSYTNVNPGARIYYLDDKTFELLDYDQYYLDIKLKAQATVKKLYSAKETYGMPDFSATSMMNFAIRMQNDQALFTKHFQNRKSQSGSDGSCSGNCKTSTLCRMVTSTRRHRDSCDAFGINTVDRGVGINSANKNISYKLNFILATIVIFVLLL